MVAKALAATTAVVGAGVAAANLLTKGASLGETIKGAIPFKGSLPSPNLLSSYASYDYVIGIAAMSKDDINNPDATYKAGKVMEYICKSAGSDPTNRIRTPHGQFDFYVDNLSFESIIGYVNPKGTTVTTLQFDVFEPYSIGQFMLSLQAAAYKNKWLNWRDAPFLLTIEFRGNKENGQISNIPFATRHIPIKLTTVQMKSTEQGTRYSINAFATQGQAWTAQYANLRTETAIKGKTVQEILQTGEQSLQAVVNKKLQEYVEDDTVAVADQIVILFPETIASSDKSGQPKAGESNPGATVSPSPSSAGDVYKKIGVNKSTLVQAPETINVLGKASLGLDYNRLGEQSPIKEGAVYDKNTDIWKRGNMTVNPKEGTVKFTQDVDIPTVIHQILLTSSYPETVLKGKKMDKDGFRKWWRIDPQVYYIDSDENLKKTGTYPRLIVYRVVLYDTHSGAITASNEQPVGYDNIKSQVVKRYDYIYTGQNSEVINFNIDFSLAFSNILAADNYYNNVDVKRQKKDNPDDKKQTPVKKPDGSKPGNKPNNPNQSRNDATSTGLANNGLPETINSRLARVFHDAISNEIDMVVLDMDIWGDPYWIVSSGQGNYTAKPVQGVKDLNSDGSVNWQNGEVDIIVNFRTPMDINSTTGMYDFKGPNHTDMSRDPKAGFTGTITGLYRVNRVISSFRQGQFTQKLKGFRRNLQELQKQGKPEGSINNEEKSKKADS